VVARCSLQPAALAALQLEHSASLQQHRHRQQELVQCQAKPFTATRAAA
jgi:hypothetical protein